MASKLKLVIGKPLGLKGEKLLSNTATLVNNDTGEKVPGVSNIRLSFPERGVISCTADIAISNIEFADEPFVAGRAFVDLVVDLEANDKIGAQIELADAAALGYQLPPLREQAEPGNGEEQQ